MTAYGYIGLLLLCTLVPRPVLSLFVGNAINYYWASNEDYLSESAVQTLCDASNQAIFENDLLSPIMRVRVPDTPAIAEVRQHITSYLSALDWTIEEDAFTDNTPMGMKNFVNVIATQYPNAERRLTLACHYDSKYFSNIEFIGMTDSAVPCAMLLDLARVLTPHIRNTGNYDTSLQFLFFDGEEAFRTWTDTDSLYGARHLANRMSLSRRKVRRELTVSDLESMDMMILLDLIGAANPTFKNWFQNTSPSFQKMQQIEERLIDLGETTGIRGRRNKYFVEGLQRMGGIQDDHIPYLRKGVPIVHLIAHPFPSVWHKQTDNASAFHYKSTDDINKILRVFVAEYLGLIIL